jgi:geranylgeranyl diphosphate synthase type II
MDIKSYLREKRELVESFLESYFETPLKPSVLYESMKYSMLAGGKRIRPVLCLAAYEAFGGDPRDVLRQACSIEFIHTYSLIHDDLPAMDNDDLRRGKPTNHIVFGEAMAILAGDALLTEAFRIFSDNKKIPPESMRAGIYELSFAAGVMGMVAGQAQDILSENSRPDEETVHFIHRNKTAALIRGSVRIGAILAGVGDPDITSCTTFGENIGLAFQIIDDILDIEASTEVLGKPSGSDLQKQKMTYPSVFGIARSRERALKLIDDAIDSIKKIQGNAQSLVGIAEYLSTRTS